MPKLKNINNLNLNEKEKIEKIEKLVSYSSENKYKQRPHQLKIPTMTCPIELVEAFKNEAKVNRLKYTTLMTIILEERYKMEKTQNEDD